jgi:hypothetical protein
MAIEEGHVTVKACIALDRSSQFVRDGDISKERGVFTVHSRWSFLLNLENITEDNTPPQPQVDQSHGTSLSSNCHNLAIFMGEKTCPHIPAVPEG